jgi:hypothetical protein
VSSSPGEWPDSGLRRARVAGSGLTLVCEGFAGHDGGAGPVEIGFDVVDWKFEPMLFGMERLAVFFRGQAEFGGVGELFAFFMGAYLPSGHARPSRRMKRKRFVSWARIETGL